jgi:hypothetical protein
MMAGRWRSESPATECARLAATLIPPPLDLHGRDARFCRRWIHLAALLDSADAWLHRRSMIIIYYFICYKPK